MSEAIIEGAPNVPESAHRTVLLDETLDLLRPGSGAVVVDATVGAGGHAEGLLDRIGPRGRLIGLDRDRAALERATRRLARFGDRFRPIHADHHDLARCVREEGFFVVDTIVADLGISSVQLDDPERGFSFQADGPLDMRMDRSTGPTAAELIADATEEDLRRILRTWGEERLAAPIARAIVRARQQAAVTRTRQLAEIVESVAGPRARRFRIHPATRTFQALRIAVNGEVARLPAFVAEAASMLRRGGRLAVIAFHSLEDRAIKRTMRELANRCVCPPGLPVCGCGRENLVRILTPRPVRPSEDEVAGNPRARSAKLRAVERL